MRIPDWLVRRLRLWADEYMASHPVAQPITKPGPQGDLLILRWDVFDMPYFHVRLHKLLGSDDGRSVHDHPWWNVSAILEGEYYEVMPRWVDRHYPAPGPSHETYVRRREGDVVVRSALARHRIELETCYYKSEEGYPLAATSLFIHGRNKRIWGFWGKDGFTPAPNQRRM